MFPSCSCCFFLRPVGFDYRGKLPDPAPLVGQGPGDGALLPTLVFGATSASCCKACRFVFDSALHPLLAPSILTGPLLLILHGHGAGSAGCSMAASFQCKTQG